VSFTIKNKLYFLILYVFFYIYTLDDISVIVIIGQFFLG